MIFASLIPDSLNNVAAIAIIASAAAFYNQIKNGLQKFFSVFVRTDSITDPSLAQEFLAEILSNSRIIRWGNSEYYCAGNDFIKKYNIYDGVIQRKDYTLICIYKNIPIICKSIRSGLSITYLYKTFNFKKKLEETHKILTDRTIANTKLWESKTTFYIMDVEGLDTKFSTSEIGSAPSDNGSEGLVLSQNTTYFHYSWLRDSAVYININYSDIGQASKSEKKSYYWSKEALKLRDEIQFFISNNKWFLDKQIPNRRGVLLTGGAGVGKSKMVLEAAKYNNVPIKRLNISNMSDNEFRNNYNSSGTKHIILLIEDIDCIIDGRVNILAKSSLTKNLLSFDTLINTISGAKEANGLFLVITTNNPDKVDAALKRAGRLDVKIEVGPLDKDGRMFIAKNILGDLNINLDEIVESCEAYTAAEFENFCVEKFISHFYKNEY